MKNASTSLTSSTLFDPLRVPGLQERLDLLECGFPLLDYHVQAVAPTQDPYAHALLCVDRVDPVDEFRQVAPLLDVLFERRPVLHD